VSNATAFDFDFDCVTVSDVSRAYGRRRALNRVSASFASGEIVGLLGPNGAGKSTLLGLLSTLIEPSSGEVRYGGKTAREAGPALRARLGLLAHELQLYPELTARENLEFFAGLYGLSEPPRSAAAALSRAGLSDRADDIVQGFSRGMRQRLALERALQHEPRLVLLDEPFTGLDEPSSRALADRLCQLRADRRVVVLATHDLEAVDGLLDRALVLRDGRVVALADSGGSLRERYRAGLQRT
jgi:heme exporter protein A